MDWVKMDRDVFVWVFSSIHTLCYHNNGELTDEETVCIFLRSPDHRSIDQWNTSLTCAWRRHADANRQFIDVNVYSLQMMECDL